MKRFLSKYTQFDKGKIDTERRTVTTQIMQWDEPDLQGDRITQAEGEKAVDYYMANSQVVGRMHTEPTDNYQVRAWTDESGAYLTTKIVDESDWDAIVSGKFGGTSWGGYSFEQGNDDGTVNLHGIEMEEDSLVTVPAVQTATFKTAEDAPEEWVSLAERIRSGEVKRRVMEPAAKEAVLALDKRMEAIEAKLKQSATSTLEGEEYTEEVSEMTPEEIKAMLEESLKGINDSVEALAEKVEGIEELLESTDVEVEETETDEAKALADANAKIEELEGKLEEAVASGKKESDGEVEDEPEPRKIARCSEHYPHPQGGKR